MFLPSLRRKTLFVIVYRLLWTIYSLTVFIFRKREYKNKQIKHGHSVVYPYKISHSRTWKIIGYRGRAWTIFETAQNVEVAIL